MPARLTLVHKLLGSEHVYTSPDLRGLHVSAPTHAQAQREAIVVVDAIAAELGVSPPVVTFREVVEAA